MFEKSNSTLVLLLLLVIFGVILVACGYQTDAEPKVVTIIFTEEFDSLSPLYSDMWVSAVTHRIWNASAWDFDEDNNPRPMLITEMPSVENGGISEGGRVITLKLRNDIFWSDGEPITSDDFVFTYEMSVDPANSVISTYPYDLIENVRAPDARTFVMTFSEPFVPWASALRRGILPAHVLRPVYEAEGTLDGAEWNRAPTVGAGSYVFSEWESGSFARFVANENYWGGRPNIDEIFIRFVPDDAAQVAALLSGEGDLGTYFAYSDAPKLEEAGLQILTIPSGYNEGWYFYLGEDAHPAMKDVRVRQAIAMAFDRFTLTKDLLLGLTQPAATFWDGTQFADPSIEPWPYDPERAKELLNEAGWIDNNGDDVRDKDGVQLVLTHGSTTRDIVKDVQLVAQQQLAEVGIKLEISNYEPNILFSGYGGGSPAATGQLDIFEWSDRPLFPDPDINYWLCSEIPSDENPYGINWQALCDEEVDALLRAQTSQVDFDERQQTFYELSRKIYENVYWLGIWQDQDIWAINSRLDNVRISAVTPFFNVAEWDLK